MPKEMKELRYLILAGNILFALWILWNGIDEGFHATRLQFVSYLFLWLLLAANSFLIFKK